MQLPVLHQQKTAKQLCQDLGVTYTYFKKCIKENMEPETYLKWYGATTQKRYYNSREVEYLRTYIF